ncbi:TonB-dependent receptor [Parabacteroides sp. PF5-6]|uniref:SusC/RagA family TonB-linked outer membrane protein n=1 Tax=Parabacteroides sp. PF5-6 TaxID=1742403 RepID=UPI0024076E4D|nr:TonB-dependent receptor [Parabacteroides sp. PF5-6]MDF9830862.1 TonB-linked SusC/RagA family outer membrane protein [Parabacteroides sp. PF5-6]
MKRNHLIYLLALLCPILAYGQGQITVSGTVRDAYNEGIPGASVVEKGTTNGTVTDIDGQFTIQVSDPNTTLQISFIGYKAQEVALAGRTTLQVALLEDVEQLEEVVVVGYGTQKKSSMTASVASVSTKEINKLVTSNVASALQGRVPGVEVLQKGGEAGAEVKILVRGAGTFGETEPLYVIDGAFSNNGLNTLNPNDIESIEILKDGAAAAIYGSRAANGVVLITTKYGEKGKTKVNITGTYSMQTPSKKLDFMNAEEYRTYAKMLVENSPGATQAVEVLNPSDPNLSTDWQDVYLRNAPIYNVNASISGGSENSTFNTSIGYFDQTGITEFSNYEKYNARINGSYKKGRLSVKENLSVAYTNKEPQTRMVLLLPTLPLKDNQGRYVSSGSDYYINGSSGSTNPMASLANQDRRSRVVNVTGSLSLSLNILKGLNYNFNMGGDYVSTHGYTHSRTFESRWDENGIADDQYTRKINSLSESKGQRFNYTIDNTVNYSNEFDGHTIDAMVGTSWMREYYRLTSTSSPSDVDLGGPSITVFNGTGSINGEEYNSALLSYFARVNYNYDNRYLLSASIRSDKSSKFAKGHRVGYFPSVSGGWNVHNEEFFNVSWLSKLKIRASYGQLGANFINPYSFLSVAHGPIPAIFGTNQTASNRSMGYVTRFAQENLTWEKTISQNYAIEIGLLNNALQITAEYFVKDNNDLLASLAPLPSSGQMIYVNEGTNPVFNSASVRNKGFELAASYRKNWGDWGLNLDGNISFLRNKVKSLGVGVLPIPAEVFTSGNFNDRPTITKPGLPIATFWGYNVMGIDDSGNFIFEDNNGLDSEGNLTGLPDGQIDENDKTNIGNPHPDFTYGLNIGVNYKNWDLSMFFQGSQGNDIFALMKYDWYFSYNGGLLTDALNSWTPTNTNTDVPIAKTSNINGGNALPSTFYVEDGSYLRLKNLQVGYTVDAQVLKKAHIDNLRVYVSAQNLFTITKYPLYDPEVNANTLFDRGVDGFYISQNSAHAATYNAKVFNIGFQLTF